MNKYDRFDHDLKNFASNFSARDIKALSSGIGLGETKQRTYKAEAHPQINVQQTLYHEHSHPQAVKPQKVKPPREKSSLFKFNRFVLTMGLDILFMVAAVASVATVVITFFKLEIDFVNFQFNFMEVTAATSVAVLAYFLSMQLFIGNSLGRILAQQLLKSKK